MITVLILGNRWMMQMRLGENLEVFVLMFCVASKEVLEMKANNLRVSVGMKRCQ